MKKIIFFILFLVIICNAFAQNPIAVSITLYDEQIYFLGDDIYIKLSVKNTSLDTYRFKIADRKVFSIDFQISTATNRPMALHSEEFKSARNDMKPVFYRDISLAPGEEYSIVQRLNDYITLTQYDKYIVQALFFPGLYIDSSSISFLSNKISLNVRPAAATTTQREIREAEIVQNEKRESLSPDQVVTFMLKARQINHMPKFFLYINLEQLYLNHYLKSKESRDQYYRLSEEQRRARVAQYKSMIVGGEEEWQFMLASHDFEILKTEYSKFNATVMVKQVFKHPDFYEYRRYTYTLSRTNPTNTWEIIDYEVKNIDADGR